MCDVNCTLNDVFALGVIPHGTLIWQKGFIEVSKCTGKQVYLQFLGQIVTSLWSSLIASREFIQLSDHRMSRRYSGKFYRDMTERNFFVSFRVAGGFVASSGSRSNNLHYYYSGIYI